MAVEPLNDYARFPRMVHWFSPSLLLALLNNVILSSIFGRYADRRLTIAALDTVSIDEHMDRATALWSGSISSPILATASTARTRWRPCWAGRNSLSTAGRFRAASSS